MEPIIALAAHLAAGLVLVAGVGKLRRPEVTGDALGLPVGRLSRLAVRGLGAGELALAVAVLTVGGRTAFALLAATYLGFVVVTAVQARRARSCGCFGVSTTRTGGLHLGVNLLAAAAAGSAALTAVPGLQAVLPTAPVPALIGAGLVALGVGLARLVLTELVEVLDVSRRMLTEARA